MPLGPPTSAAPALAAAPPDADDPELDRLIRAERLRMLFAPTAPVAIVSAFVAIGLAWAVREQTGQGWALSWAALCALTSLARLGHLLLHLRATDRDHPRWLDSLTLMCGLHGLSWGLIGVLMPVGDMVTTTVIGAMLVGACAVSAFTLQAHFRPNLATCAPMLLPAGLALFARQDNYGLFGGFGMLALLAVMLWESRRAERRITELLWLRFTTDRIARERTRALLMAQRHSAIKDQFLATMSHEMRTPLHGILGLSRLVQERLPERPGVLAEAHQHLGLIERTGEHLLRIINDVLDFSRIEAGKLHIENGPFDLHALLQEVLALQGVGARDKGLRLQAEVQLPRPCWVNGDAARLRQMLHNLLGNAIKFTELGQVQLSAYRLAEGEDEVRFDVIDTGVGIAPEQLALIFEAFHQVDGSALGQKGTGLGLTITREIARAMGGDVVCDSVPGRGSVFTLTVPLAPVHGVVAASGMGNLAEAASSTGAPTGAPSTVPAALPPALAAGGMAGHVLLVEDNPVNALVAEATLGRLGLTVTRVDDGLQALPLLESTQRPYQLVLMDLQMPGLDGTETTRRLRRWEQSHRMAPVPVIALTANALSSDRARCLAAGMNDHLPKPFRRGELEAVLARHLVGSTAPATGH